MKDKNSSWKNNKNVFKKQLSLNLKELNSISNYPEHWRDFLVILNKTFINTLLDIGCGCGAYYQLIHRHHKNIDYTGLDYSNEAIELAKKTWNYKNFFVRDFWTLNTEYIANYDLIHTSAVFDVMSNGDEALEFLLDLRPKKLIISRMAFTKDNKSSYYETYLAYEELLTYKYYHNIDSFLSICNKYNYKISQFNSNILLYNEQF